MRRTQLYLDDQLWWTLHAIARSGKTSVSELVRRAVRDCYVGDLKQRKAAMLRFVGSRAKSTPTMGAVQEVRSLRRGKGSTDSVNDKRISGFRSQVPRASIIQVAPARRLLACLTRNRH
ncbi:MAG: ribbon-helix-helix protein, CopG family [Candidatus Solibacter usitatus]|nr:ribbon-helix-helix protein, CopG family [Candidatus Solibacter usitatus]